MKPKAALAKRFTFNKTVVRTGELGIIGEVRMESEEDRQIAASTQSGSLKDDFLLTMLTRPDSSST